MATVTLRPDGVDSYSQWANEDGTAPTASRMNDNSDATYTTKFGGSGGQHAVVAFGTFALPTNATIVSLTPRVRADTVDGLKAYRWRFDLAGVLAFENQSFATGINNVTGQTETLDPNGAAWTQTTLDAIRVRIANGSAFHAPLFHELYIDVVYTLSTEASALLSGTGDLSAAAAQTIFASALLTGTGDLSAGSPPSIDSLCGAGYGMAPYSLGPYSNVGPCLDSVYFVDTPTSNVEEFDTSAERLGCGTPSVFITSRCSGSMTCMIDLSDITKLMWTRRLNEVSEAEVEIGLSGDATQTCCQCLASLEPFCHELHIWRDGDEVWVGPIEAIRYERDLVTIKAKDSLAWLDVRIPINDVEFKAGGLSGPASDLTVIAEFIINTAFQADVDIGHTCEVDNLYSINTGEVSEWYSERFNETALEILIAVAETQLNFTVIGRTIVLNDELDSLTPLSLLNDEHIMGDIEVTKDGKLLGNRQWVHYNLDGGVPALSEATDSYCYGPIERITDINEIQLVADAEAAGDAMLKESYIAPRIVEIPAGSRLSPDTPWTINQMVPGAKVDVAITRLCLEMTRSFMLIGVSVEYSSNDGEAVGIELSPINIAPIIVP